MRNWKGGELCVSTLDQGRCVCVQLRATTIVLPYTGRRRLRRRRSLFCYLNAQFDLVSFVCCVVL